MNRTTVIKIGVTTLVTLILLVTMFVWKPWKSGATPATATTGVPTSVPLIDTAAAKAQAAAAAATAKVAELEAKLAAVEQRQQTNTPVVQPTAAPVAPAATVREGQGWNQNSRPTKYFGNPPGQPRQIKIDFSGLPASVQGEPKFQEWADSLLQEANRRLVRGQKPSQVQEAFTAELRKMGVTRGRVIVMTR